MAEESRWQQLFPNATPSDAKAYIDGNSYFEAVADALETATGRGHYIVISGWMLDIKLVLSSKKPKVELREYLEKAASRGVSVILLIWDNPSYLKKHEEALKWTRSGILKDLHIIIDNNTTSSSKSKELVEFLANQIRYQEWYSRPGASADIKIDIKKPVVHMLLKSGDPSALDIEKWARSSKFSIATHHEKNIVVIGNQGSIAFCGGMDLNPNRINLQSPKHHSYHDAAVEVRGQAAVEVLNKCIIRMKETQWYIYNSNLIGGLEKAASSQNYTPQAAGVKVQIVGTYNSISPRLKIRTASDAYMSILRNAKRYIYIEDQYLVHTGVAKEINARILDDNFELAMFIVQDSDETGDIAIPNRKRRQFMAAVLKNAAPKHREKVLYAVIRKDDRFWSGRGYHTGMHSKLMVVDDEIAMIGSLNVNRRSFDLDSETSAVVFGGDFAKNLRMELWNHTLQPMLSLPGEQAALEFLTLFPDVIRKPIRKPGPFGRLTSTYLVEYIKANQLDLDFRIIDKINAAANWKKDFVERTLDPIVEKIWTVGARPKVSAANVLDNPDLYVPQIIDVIWDVMIDPK